MGGWGELGARVNSTFSGVAALRLRKALLMRRMRRAEPTPGRRHGVARRGARRRFVAAAQKHSSVFPPRWDSSRCQTDGCF